MSCHLGPRRFVLMHDRDPTGVSGTGMVAEGVLFSDNKAVMAWRTPYRSIVIYERLGDLEAVHGHSGQTRVVWLRRG
jgi:hypothetical protein